MSEELRDNHSQPQHPALKGFNRSWEYLKHTLKETGMMALKGAVVIGLVAATGSLIFAAPAGGAAGLIGWITGGAVAPAWGNAILAGAAVQGALVGALGGAAIGLARGLGGAEDAAEEKEQSLISKHNRAKQYAMNQKMLEQGMAKTAAWQAGQKQRAMQHGNLSPGFSPGMGQDKDGVSIS